MSHNSHDVHVQACVQAPSASPVDSKTSNKFSPMGPIHVSIYFFSTYHLLKSLAGRQERRTVVGSFLLKKQRLLEQERRLLERKARLLDKRRLLETGILPEQTGRLLE